ncbi:hypothetical protein D3C73_1151420 [compost metagenome]
MVVAPASGRKRFQLKVGVDGGQVTAAPLLMAAVVKDRQAGLHGIDGLTDAAGVVQVGHFAQGGDGGFVARILPGCPQRSHTILAAAFADADDIKKDAVCVIARDNFVDLRQQNIQIRRIKAKFVIPRRHKILHPACPVLGIADQPFRMTAGQLLIQTGR